MEADHKSPDIANPKLMLNLNMVTTILTSLLGVDPKYPLHLPDFRIRELLSKLSKHVEPPTEIKLLESIGSLYCLCLYYAISPRHGVGTIFDFFLFSQRIIEECIIQAGPISSVSIETADPVAVLQRDTRWEEAVTLKVFSSALDVAREIVREVLAKIRQHERKESNAAMGKVSIMEKMKKEKEAKKKKTKKQIEREFDCLQPHAILFMCAFAQAHIAVNLSANGLLNYYPGLLESSVILLLVKPHIKAEAVVAKTVAVAAGDAKQIVEKKRTQAQIDADAEDAKLPGLEKYVDIAVRVAVHTAHIIFEETSLQVNRMAYSRMIKCFTHSDILFAQHRVTSRFKERVLVPHEVATSSSSATSAVLPHGAASIIIPASTTASVTADDHKIDLKEWEFNHQPKQARSQSVSLPPLSPHRNKNIPKKLPKELHRNKGQSPPLKKGMSSPSRKGEGERMHGGCEFPVHTAIGKVAECFLVDPRESEEQDFGDTKDVHNNAAGVLNSLIAGEELLERQRAGNSNNSSNNNKKSGTSESDAGIPRAGNNNNNNKIVDTAESRNSSRSSSRRPSLALVSSPSKPELSSTKESNISGIGTAGSLISSRAHSPTTTSTSTGRITGPQTQRSARGLAKNESNSAIALSSRSTTAKEAIMGHNVAGVAVNISESTMRDSYWNLPKFYRSTYLLFMTLYNESRNKNNIINEYFPARYKLPKNPAIVEDILNAECGIGFDTMTLKEASTYIESQIFYNTKDRVVPRIMNPVCEIYWVCRSVIEYLHDETRCGRGFCPKPENEVRELREHINSIKSQVKKQKEAEQRSAQKKYPPVATVASTGTGTGCGDVSGKNNNKKSSQKSSSSFVSLEDKLNMAVQHAKLESRVITIEKELKRQAQPKDLDRHLQNDEDTSDVDALCYTEDIAENLGEGLDEVSPEKRNTFRQNSMYDFDKLFAINEGVGGEESSSVGGNNSSVGGNGGSVGGKYGAGPLGKRSSSAAAAGPASLSSSSGHHKLGRGGGGGGAGATSYNGSQYSHASGASRGVGGGIGGDLGSVSSNTVMTSNSHLNLSSVIWNARPKEVANSSVKLVFACLEDDKDDLYSTMPSKQASKEYAKQMLEIKKAYALAEQRAKQALQDQQEIEQLKARNFKVVTLKTMKETAREEQHAKAALLETLEEQKRLQYAEDKAKRRAEEKAKTEAESNEKLRIRQIKILKENQEKREAKALADALELNRKKIRYLGDAKETEEIIRRAMEEDRMRYLEAQRKKIEDRLEAQRQAKEDEKNRKKQMVHDITDQLESKVRMGTFKWHNGKYSFYPDVRAKPVSWIQYEDENGTPYYYDPITGNTQYRKPNDAPVRHYTEDERAEYDEQWGEGAYDAMVADRAFKDQVNADGGWYNKTGDWVDATGYYDENYEWVQYDGYTDENGVYIKYAKVEGNLDFMV